MRGLAACALLMATPAWSLPAYVQDDCRSTAATTASTSVALSGVQAENLLVVAVSFPHAGQTPSISDSQGNSYQAAAPLELVPAGTDAHQVFFAFAGSSGANTVTVRTDAPVTSGFLNLFVSEFSGLTSLDSAAVQSGTTNDPFTATVVTSNADTLLYAFVASWSPTSPGPGFVSRSSCRDDYSEDAVVGPTGPYFATFIGDAGNQWGTTIAAFRAAPDAAGGGAVQDPLRLRVGCGCAEGSLLGASWLAPMLLLLRTRWRSRS